MTFNQTISEKLFQKAQSVIPGGVNSPVRAFKSVGGVPPFIKRAEGAFVYDADGNEYIDMLCAYGPIIIGHQEEEIDNASNIDEINTVLDYCKAKFKRPTSHT